MENFKEIFKEIIEEDLFNESEKDEIYPRTHEVSAFKNKAIVLIGSRRAGKSTLLLQIIGNKKNKVFLNFEDERLIDIKVGDLQSLLDAYVEINPHYEEGQELHLALDEIQGIVGWEKFVERQIRVKNRFVWITGSSAKMLSKEIATTLRGRSLSYEVFPFSFQELLSIKKISKDSKRSSKIKRQVFLKECVLGSCYPEVFDLAQGMKNKILQEYFNVMIVRDIAERHHISSIDQIKATLRILFQSLGTKFSINKIVEKLKSSGYSSDKELCSEIIQAAKDCFLVFTVKIWAKSIHKQNINPKKIYLIDNGLFKAIIPSHGIDEDFGHLFENFIFLHLRRLYSGLFYYKTKEGYEVDFYIPEKKWAIQVMAYSHAPETLEREIRALKSAMQELQLKESFLISLEKDEMINTKEGKIHLISASNFLLGLGDVK